MATKKLLDKAKKNKNDEFYTQLSDIEREIKNYKKHFKEKIVFCNCDDPDWSNFWKYFEMNFEHLGLKKLIATHFSKNTSSYKLELSNENGKLVKSKTNLKGNGDFKSSECLEICKEADIIVTNPPFSLFREYVSQLIDYDKKFLIIGHQNAISYKEIFSLFKENKIWLGYGFFGGATHFYSPHYEDYATAGNHKEGMIRVSGVHWFTNLDIDKRHEELFLYKKYSPKKYSTYENFIGINVDKTKEIPYDYDGIMGVPITFMDKYSPEQFEIIGLGIVGSCEFTNNREMEILKEGKPTGRTTWNAKGTLYRKFNPKKDKYPTFKDVKTGKLYSSIYARILIKRKA